MTFCEGICHIYQNPDILSQHMDEAFFGIGCEISEEQGDFYKIKTEYGYEGYVLKNTVCENGYEPDFIVVFNGADLYPEPRTYHGPVYSLPRGSRVKIGEVAGEDKNFYEVFTPKGERLYIFSRTVLPFKVKTEEDRKKENEEMFRNAIVETAKKYVGSQYRWGGKTVMGIDCSGLAFMSYYLNGYYIYRDARPDRQTTLRQISWSEIKKGDLLYYKGHVAIYCGGGEVIHSTNAYGGVMINTLDPLSLRYRGKLVNEFITACTFF